MADPYLYADTPVLKNKLDIRDEKVLDLVEAEQSRANMMLLYERGFSDFTPAGLCEIHRFLFGDIYDWAGKYRIINIEKREKLLAGRSVWYSNDEDIPRDLENAFQELLSQDWPQFSRQEFVRHLTACFPKIWQVHPFREGNTPDAGYDDDLFRGASRILYGSGIAGSQLRLCAGLAGDGIAGSIL